MALLAAVAVARMPILFAPVIAAAATAATAPYVPCMAAITPRVVSDADLPGANAARTAVAGRAARCSRPHYVRAAALAAVGLPMPLLAVIHWTPAVIFLVSLTGTGALLVEILTETWLQRTLDEEVFGPPTAWPSRPHTAGSWPAHCSLPRSSGQ